MTALRCPVLVLASLLWSLPLGASEPESAPPNLISRSEWGAKPPVKPYRTHTISRITIHHQGVRAFARQDAAKRLRTMQAFHLSKSRGFADIAYHFVIDRRGRVYEGRPATAPGETRTGYNPEGHLLICLLGDFRVQAPTAMQLRTLEGVVRWALASFHLTADTVKGHRDYAATDCPGKNLYRMLPSLVKAQ